MTDLGNQWLRYHTRAAWLAKTVADGPTPAPPGLADVFKRRQAEKIQAEKLVLNSMLVALRKRTKSERRTDSDRERNRQLLEAV